MLGPESIVARSVNGQSGMWVGFAIERDNYWLLAEATHANARQALPKLA